MNEKKFLDYIEIGTSDFETEVQKTDGGNPRNGISIDCIDYYLDRLPNKKENLKLNYAISESNGYIDAFYLDELTIEKYNLPKWVRGCNSIISPHLTVKNLLIDIKICDNNNVDSFFIKKEVKKITLYQLYQIHNIYGVYYLKIDTEGHDTFILNKFLQDYNQINDNSILPHKILFESNKLTSQNLVEITINNYREIGYDCHYSNKNGDTLLRLNLNDMKKNKNFSTKLKRVYIQKDLPENYYLYDENKNKLLPHENTLEGAMKYCVKYNCNGIQLVNNVYEVRKGKYLCAGELDDLCWILL